MTQRSKRRRNAGGGKELTPRLQAVAAAVQQRWVLPHCPRCLAPCCTLESLVLELDWRRLRLLWGIGMPRKRFDERLAAGKGPPEVRMQDGLYYVHGKVCPAYRERLCAVYGSDVKPSGCSDFPIYVDDDGGLLADLRCEALSAARVEAALLEILPTGSAVRRRKHPDFPFLITFHVGAGGTADRPAPVRRRRRRA